MDELIFEALTQGSGDNVEGLLPDPCTAAALNVGLHKHVFDKDAGHAIDSG